VKKFLLSIITLIYMTVSSGIAMEMHYCMGKPAGVDFYKSENEKCSRCGMKEKKNGCCHDEHKFHKLQDSHKNVFNNISFETGDLALETSYAVFNWQLPVYDVSTVVHNNSPPFYTMPSACIMNCVFRL
jgi:hypothetical protein